MSAKRRPYTLAYLLFAILVPNAAAQSCVSYMLGLTNPTISSIGLVADSTAVTSYLSSAAANWTKCSGIPNLIANQSVTSNGFTINVYYHSGGSTRADGVCADGRAESTQMGMVNGGTVDVWANWGPNPTPGGVARPDLANQPCTLSMNGN